MDETDRSLVEDIEYWRSLNPQSSISTNPFQSEASPYAITESMDVHLAQLKREGYFHTSPVVPQQDVDKLVKIIRNVVEAGERSTYALLYDDFYRVAANLENLLTPILGSGYQLVPDEFEAYMIDAESEEAGSEPHRDSLSSPKSINSAGLPSLINVWVALTDATPLNSCMYVLPAHLDPDYPNAGVETVFKKTDRRGIPLQDIRAVPVKAGSVVCWSTSLLHWGGRSSRYADQSRFSFAMYFQRGDVPQFHPTTTDIPCEIPFEYRLYLTEKVWRDPEGDGVHLVRRSSGVECVKLISG